MAPVTKLFKSSIYQLRPEKWLSQTRHVKCICQLHRELFSTCPVSYHQLKRQCSMICQTRRYRQSLNILHATTDLDLLIGLRETPGSSSVRAARFHDNQSSVGGQLL